MEIPKRLIDLLEENKVRYEVLKHPEAPTAQELAAVEHVKGRFHVKVVMVKNDGKMLMTAVPSDRRIDWDKLEEKLGTPAELASEEEFRQLFPDCAVGRMPPFGKLYGVPVIVDKNLQGSDFIVFEAGTNTDSIKMAYSDFERLAEPGIAEFTTKM